MKETYSKVEIIRPKRSGPEQFGVIAASLFLLALRTLIVWWAIAAWFPELGVTYWQLILPVYAFRALILPNPPYVRQIAE